jgi:hypothetical protein
MTSKMCIFAALALGFCAFSARAADTETFDKIVLKDMTVIKAGLVKEVGDSLAYFELNDPDFVKHMISKDQVFKWVKAASQPGPAPKTAAPAAPVQKAPPPDTGRKPPQNPQPEIATAPAVKDSVKDSIPMVDYQVVLARLDSIDRSKQRPAIVASLPVKAAAAMPVAAPAPVAVEYDTSEAVPENLAKVRLDPPTGTEGVKIVPRSGLVAININPSFTSLGLGFRTWSAGGFGFSAGAAVLWGSASGFTVKAQPMLALNAKSGTRIRWYLFPMIGYQWISYSIPSVSVMGISTPSASMDLSLMNFAFGLGAEWRVGINRNHGLAVEIGYQGGSADYTIHTDAHTYNFGYGPITTPPSDTKGTYSPSPFYLMFSYAYYF